MPYLYTAILRTVHGRRLGVICTCRGFRNPRHWVYYAFTLFRLSVRLSQLEFYQNVQIVTLTFTAPPLSKFCSRHWARSFGIVRVTFFESDDVICGTSCFPEWNTKLPNVDRSKSPCDAKLSENEKRLWRLLWRVIHFAASANTMKNLFSIQRNNRFCFYLWNNNAMIGGKG